MDAVGEIDLARERLAQACGAARRRLAEVRASLTALREQQVRQGSGAADELAAFARTVRAPAALRAVQRRVDLGELTWTQVVLGAGGDPEVRAVRALLGRGLAPLPAAVRRGLDRGTAG
jgi:hypothetical protein